MYVSKINAYGEIVSEPKQGKDGEGILLLKNENNGILKDYPKEFQRAGETYYYVHIYYKVWMQLKHILKKGDVISVSGNCQAIITKKGKAIIEIFTNRVKTKGGFEVREYSLNRGNVEDENTLDTEENGDIVNINLADIKIVEKIHKEAGCLNINVSKDAKNNNPMVIRKLEDGTYGLVSGITRYYRCKLLEINEYPCIITELCHSEYFKDSILDKLNEENAKFIMAVERLSKIREEKIKDKNVKKDKPKVEDKRGTTDEIKLEDIIIPTAFLNTRPRQEKIDEVKANYKKNGKFDKLIVVSIKNNTLKDGYARYVAAVEMGLEKIEVIFK